MNLQEEKAGFMAQYIGQPTDNSGNYSKIDYMLLNMISMGLGDLSVLLRTVDMLTDEECIKCAQTGFDYFNCISADYTLKVIRERKGISVAAISVDGKTCLVKLSVSDVYKLNLHQIDYLRSIGILIPWREYSTEQILDMGWAKVKEAANG